MFSDSCQHPIGYVADTRLKWKKVFVISSYNACMKLHQDIGVG